MGFTLMQQLKCLYFITCVTRVITVMIHARVATETGIHYISRDQILVLIVYQLQYSCAYLGY